MSRSLPSTHSRVQVLAPSDTGCLIPHKHLCLWPPFTRLSPCTGANAKGGVKPPTLSLFGSDLFIGKADWPSSRLGGKKRECELDRTERVSACGVSTWGVPAVLTTGARLCGGSGRPGFIHLALMRSPSFGCYFISTHISDKIR